MQKILRYSLFFLPRKLISHWFGVLMHIRWPWPLSRLTISWFACAFSIDMDIAEKELSEYRSIGDLFVRRLKRGSRPIEASATLVHPADSAVTQSQPIQNGKLIQAKGKDYLVGDLLQDEKLAQYFEGGWSLVYYLCPTDYHRVHSPISGRIRRLLYLPGSLWPVNEWSVNKIDRLFAVNERVVVEIESDQGVAVLVMVGATNVGKMEVFCEPQLRTNAVHAPKRKVFEYSPAIPIEKGAELGLFRMGSTVVMLYPKTMLSIGLNHPLGPVKVGEKLGK